MKQTFLSRKTFVSLLLFFLLVMAGSKTVLAADNTTKETATPFSINTSVTGTIHGSDETYYYKVTIPEDIGNQYINLSITKYDGDGDWLEVDLYDEFDKKMGYITTHFDKSAMMRLRVEGSATKETSMIKLSPGKTYYLKCRPNSLIGFSGDFVLAVTTGPSDDNWGTFDKAEAIVGDQVKSGIIEYADDIDCYSITLPNDNKNHTFILSADNDMYTLFADALGVEISNTSVYANVTNNSFSAIGKGQKIYIRIEGKKDNTNYTIKVVTDNTESEDEKDTSKKSTISTLKLTKYKKGSKKIVGKTIKSATVKVTVNKKTYKVKSNKKGNFTVKLKNKLKAKQKIKVTVSKTNYKTKTKTFKVKK